MGKKRKTPWSVFIAIVLGIVAGTFSGTKAGVFNVTFYSLYDLIGTLFIRALTLVVVPLVSASIITGMSRIGGERNFGRLGIKMFAFYLGTSFFAIIIGLVFVDLLQPGKAFADFATRASNSEINLAHVHHAENLTFTRILFDIIPSNVLEAFAKGQMLGLIFFSLIFGYAITKIKEEQFTTVQNFWNGIFQGMIQFTHIIMKTLPLGVFCLIAKVFATTGLDSLKTLLLFVGTVFSGFGVYMVIGLPLLIRLIGKLNPWHHYRAMAPAIVTAFSTSSSSASLPATIECAEKRAGISNRICSLVIPLGTSVNMAGSALYEVVAAMFVAQAYGIHYSFASQFGIAFLSLMTSMGVAGIPGGSIVAIIVILKAMGLPTEAIGMFLAVDRLLDMCRTTVNIFSDSTCALLVAKSEGETGLLDKDKISTEY